MECIFYFTSASGPDYTFDQEDDSDSNDDEGSEKLARSFSHLFTKDSSEDEDSDSDASSKYEDEGLELTPEHVVETSENFFRLFVVQKNTTQNIFFTMNSHFVSRLFCGSALPDRGRSSDDIRHRQLRGKDQLHSNTEHDFNIRYNIEYVLEK